MSGKVTDEQIQGMIEHFHEETFDDIANEVVVRALKELLELRSQDNPRFWKSEIKDLREKLAVAVEALKQVKHEVGCEQMCWDENTGQTYIETEDLVCDCHKKHVDEALRKIGVGE